MSDWRECFVQDNACTTNIFLSLCTMPNQKRETSHEISWRLYTHCPLHYYLCTKKIRYCSRFPTQNKFTKIPNSSQKTQKNICHCRSMWGQENSWKFRSEHFARVFYCRAKTLKSLEFLLDNGEFEYGRLSGQFLVDSGVCVELVFGVVLVLAVQVSIKMNKISQWKKL